MFPLSVNTQKGRNRKNNVTFIKKEQKVFRQAVQYAMASKANLWRGSMVSAAVLLFEDPGWTTKKHTVRKRDADNLVKPTLDAIQIATDHEDELYWQVHFFKVLCRETRTTVFLFDLGDVVDYYR